MLRWRLVRPAKPAAALAAMVLTTAANASSFEAPFDPPFEAPFEVPTDTPLIYSPLAAPEDDMAASGIPMATVLANQELYLTVDLNEYPTRQTVRFVLRDGALYAAGSTLQEIGIAVPDAAQGTDGMVALADIPGLQYRLYNDRQALHLSVPASSLSGGTYRAQGQRHKRPRAAFGSTLNYDLYALHGEQDFAGGRDSSDQFSSFLDYRLFGRAGTFNQTSLTRSGTDTPSEWIRLDSTWLYSDDERLISYRLGDFISGGLSWTRTVRMAGTQLQRNFSLQPDMVTFPVPLISGSAAVPSTVDIYVNNIRRLSQDVDAGPYRIEDVPVVTGEGAVRVVVRDALGREQVTTQSFYASSNLLREGLFDYSLDVGYLRNDFGLRSNEYDTSLAASSSLRYGLNPNVTIESHIAGTHDLYSLGLGTVVGLGRVGVLSTSVLSGTGENNQDGFRYRVGYRYQRRSLGVFLSTEHTDEEFVELASVTGAATIRRFDQVGVSFPILNAGFMSLGYVHIDSDGLPASADAARCQSTISGCIQGVDLRTGFGSEVGTVSYSHQFRRNWNVFVTGFKDFADDGGDGVTAGLSYYLGDRTNAFIGTDSGSDGTTTRANIGKSTPVEGTGPGWRLRAASGQQERVGAEASYRTPYARLEVTTDHYDDYALSSLAARGALVLMGESLFASNSIYDSFAVVDTQIPGVEVLHENRPVGRSNRNGNLLITNLSAFNDNRLQIDPTDLPVDVEVGDIESIALPIEKSGVIVRFPVARVQAANVQLVRADGSFLPVGAEVNLNGQVVDAVVGYDGLVYLRKLEAVNTLDVSWMEGSCVAEVAYQQIPGALPTIGPVTCE